MDNALVESTAHPDKSKPQTMTNTLEKIFMSIIQFIVLGEDNYICIQHQTKPDTGIQGRKIGGGKTVDFAGYDRRKSRGTPSANPHYQAAKLQFADNGQMSILADGQPVA